MQEHWVADRMRSIEASGIRKIFELAKGLKNPINLSIGQPHFDVPQSIKDEAKAAIDRGDNGYTVTQGVPALREPLQKQIAQEYPGQDRELLVTSGTSGALMLAICTCVNPGDEVILFDPYFVSYPNLVALAGGRAVIIDTYPGFAIDLDRVRDAITPRTKAILFSSPCNPTGIVIQPEILRGLATLAAEKGVLLISDEIYRAFAYDAPHRSAGEFDPNVLVVEGFGKAYGMTGWRLGFAHGPRAVIDEMTKLQQFTFVCAPSVVQYAGVAALQENLEPVRADYMRKRDRVMERISKHFEVVRPGGAFYAFPKAPRSTATEFVTEAIRENLLIIPGGSFSKRDTHFRISFAAADEILDRGLDLLVRLAAR